MPAMFLRSRSQAHDHREPVHELTAPSHYTAAKYDAAEKNLRRCVRYERSKEGGMAKKKHTSAVLRGT